MRAAGMSKPQFCRWLIFCSISVFAVLLNSCNTNTVSAILVTSTITVMETPSITLAPSQTSTTTPMPSPTLPPATLAVVSTMNAIVAQKPELQGLYHFYQQCVYMPYACVSPGLGLSPDGAWGVFFTGGGIRIIRVDNEKEWEVTFAELTGTPGGGTVSVVHWSQDGRYVYVVPRQDGADGGYEWFWGWRGTQLIRLDLETGTWTDTKLGYAFSFSPDNNYLAYRSDQGIHIHDLTTGQEKLVPVKYPEYGRFTWSPDSQKILFVATPNETDLEKRESGFTALLLDTKTQTIQTVFENNTAFLYPVEWKDMNNVLLEKLFAGFGEQYNLDVNTGVITSTQNP
jgi:hypothetical protein